MNTENMNMSDYSFTPVLFVSIDNFIHQLICQECFPRITFLKHRRDSDIFIHNDKLQTHFTDTRSTMQCLRCIKYLECHY